MKLAIIFHSQSGNTRQVAELIAAGAQSVPQVEVKSMSIDSIDAEFVSAAQAVIFGSPTYYGTFSWQIKQWLDTNKIKLVGKLGGVFATANNIGGGLEMAELGLIGQLLVFGMLIYSGGTAKGKPYTHFGAGAIKAGDRDQQERAKLFGQRMAEKAVELFEK